MRYNLHRINASIPNANREKSPLRDIHAEYAIFTTTPQTRQYITAHSAMYVDLAKVLVLIIDIACGAMPVCL
jgi:hypothetical protein